MRAPDVAGPLSAVSISQAALAIEMTGAPSIRGSMWSSPLTRRRQTRPGGVSDMAGQPRESARRLVAAQTKYPAVTIEEPDAGAWPPTSPSVLNWRPRTCARGLRSFTIPRATRLYTIGSDTRKGIREVKVKCSLNVVVSTIVFLGAAAPSYAKTIRPATTTIATLARKPLLSADDLIDLVSLTKATGGGSTQLVGKPFRVVVTPGLESAEGPRWWYDEVHQALSLHASIGRLSGRFFQLSGCPTDQTNAEGIEFYRTRQDQTVLSGTNRAFEKVEEQRVSLGRLHCAILEVPSGLNANVDESRRRADAQIASLTVEIEGSLQLANGQSIVTCGGEQIAAPTMARTELVIQQCVVGAAIKEIVFTADGIELARWNAANVHPRYNQYSSFRSFHFPSLQDFH